MARVASGIAHCLNDSASKESLRGAFDELNSLRQKLVLSDALQAAELGWRELKGSRFQVVLTTHY